MSNRPFAEPETLSEMLARYRQGESLSALAAVYKCDHTSVLFQVRKHGEWVPGRKSLHAVKPLEIEPETGEVIEEEQEAPIVASKYAHLLEGGKINRGKKYSEYLKAYRKQIAPIRKQRMAIARQTIRAIRREFGKARYTQDEVVVNA